MRSETMKKEEEDGVNDQMSPSSTPPTPPSPLPISTGPGNTKYIFSPSPTPSPPFSPPSSSRTSADNLPLLKEAAASPSSLTFSLDMTKKPAPPDDHGSPDSCLRDLLEWFLRRCCTCLQIGDSTRGRL